MIRDGRDRRRRTAAIRESSAPGDFFDVLASEPRLSGTAVQTVGAKGWDGFAIAVVTG